MVGLRVKKNQSRARLRHDFAHGLTADCSAIVNLGPPRQTACRLFGLGALERTGNGARIDQLQGLHHFLDSTNAANTTQVAHGTSYVVALQGFVDFAGQRVVVDRDGVSIDPGEASRDMRRGTHDSRKASSDEVFEDFEYGGRTRPHPCGHPISAQQRARNILVTVVDDLDAVAQQEQCDEQELRIVKVVRACVEASCQAEHAPRPHQHALEAPASPADIVDPHIAYMCIAKSILPPRNGLRSPLRRGCCIA